ncbi:hypothetical protein EC9_03600 [Rosistilla ulvae]|uniref:Uncharacterized protein n=1 Tax=Rosistilla ulvae TaxID=1930277 RepID=A0A517LUA4_9BACT|nr:hypothetical protein EC9_03600 [Rosistilla ulvae]
MVACGLIRLDRNKLSNLFGFEFESARAFASR